MKIPVEVVAEERGVYLDLAARCIHTEGWALVVADGPRYYTLGMHRSYGHPEIYLEGEDELIARAFIQHVVSSASLAAPLAMGENSFGGRRFYLGRARPDEIRGVTRVIGAYLGDDVPIVQLVLADQHGNFPWESGSDEGIHLFFDVTAGRTS